MIKLAIWDYVNDVLIEDVWVDAIPRKDEEIILKASGDYWLYVKYISWIAVNDSYLEPRVYVSKRLKPTP